jgi:hypothetical protein
VATPIVPPSPGGDNHVLTMILIGALTLAGLFSAVVIEHQIHALTAAVADHERRLGRIEARSRACPSRRGP